MFYSSRDGMAEGGESYLLARGTLISAIHDAAVSMRQVREMREGSPARAKVIILDACHSGALLGKVAATMIPESIHRVFEEAEGMAVVASRKQGRSRGNGGRRECAADIEPAVYDRGRNCIGSLSVMELSNGRP